MALLASGCVLGDKHTQTLIGMSHTEREEGGKERGRIMGGRGERGRRRQRKEDGDREGEGEECEMPLVSEFQETKEIEQ